MAFSFSVNLLDHIEVSTPTVEERASGVSFFSNPPDGFCVWLTGSPAETAVSWYINVVLSRALNRNAASATFETWQINFHKQRYPNDAT